MIEILFLNEQEKRWNEVLEYVQNCSWRAGKSLAMKMKEGKFTDWQRVVVLLIDSKIIGFATFVETDSIEKSGYQPFIGYVFVDYQHRGKNLSKVMIEQIISYAKMLGFKKVYLHSGEVGLYEKMNFNKISTGVTRSGGLENIYERSIDK